MEKLKLILVDDNKTFRMAIKEILQSKYKSWTIDEAGNAEEFLKLKDFQNSDLILMDIMMPGMNGIELTKKVLWDYPQLKIVANTMDIDNLTLTTIVYAGFRGYILKEDLMENYENCFRRVLEGMTFYPNYKNLALFK